jgi:cyclopropane-fatty-acyl-phospholipid synthase
MDRSHHPSDWVLDQPERGLGSGGAARARGWFAALDRWLGQRMLQSLHHPPVTLVLSDGRRVESPSPGAGRRTRLVFRDRAALYRLISNPEFQFGELYSNGRIAIEGDLVDLLESVYQSVSANGTCRDHVMHGLWRSRPNSIRRARGNIHHHYDIGNAFYQLWLDAQMLYTCAYFPDDRATLEEAQQAKMEHVCRKLRLRPGQLVFEAGCGWGGLALYMARRHGVRVRAFNISHEQVQFARQQAARQGLADRVEFVEDDYRHIQGRCDAFVSVGMLEHVGVQHYQDLGEVIDRCLSPTGMGLIHSIGRNRPLKMNAWITTRIFPGGYTPALSEMTGIFEPFGFSVLDVENLRLHYALTLRHWLARFEGSADRVAAMFDDRFVRMWRLYLAGSLVAFTTGWMQLFQVVFTRATNNDLPLTREHLYDE